MQISLSHRKYLQSIASLGLLATLFWGLVAEESAEQPPAQDDAESTPEVRIMPDDEALQEGLPAGLIEVLDPYSEDLEERVAKERALRQRSKEILKQMTKLQDGDEYKQVSHELRPGTVAHGGGTLSREPDQEQVREHRQAQHRQRFAQLDRRDQGYFTLADKLALPHPRAGSDDAPDEAVLAAWRQAREDLAPIIIEVLDADGDGRVSWEEFAAVADYRQRAADILHFRSIDTDGDGVISPEEWHDFHVQRAQVRAAMAGEKRADHYDFSESFQRFDPEDHGVIAEETFVTILSERRQRVYRARRERAQDRSSQP